MTRADRTPFFLVVALCAYALLRACMVPQPAGAQADTLVEDVVGLTMHEADGNLPDADGIYAALVNGAARRGLSTHAFARLHSRRFFAGTTARPWARALRLDCARPRGYPGAWSRRRDACVALVEHVRAIVHAPPRVRGDDMGLGAGPPPRASGRAAVPHRRVRSGRAQPLRRADRPGCAVTLALIGIAAVWLAVRLDRSADRAEEAEWRVLRRGGGR